MDNILIKAHSLTGIHEFTSSRIIENSVVVDKYAMRGDNLSYGTAIASSLSFVVYEEDPIDWNVIDYVEYFSDDTLLFRGLIEEHTRMDDTRLIECLDPLAELDKPYTSIENNEIFTTNKITASTFITKLLTIGLRDTNTPTWNIVKKFTAITDPQITKFSGDLIELYTMREVLSWALEVLGLIVYCNGADVIIKAPTVNNTVNLNTSVMVDPLEIAEHKMKLTGVLFVKEEKQIVEGKEKFVDVEILSGNTEKGYIVDNNPIILASADKTWTDSIYNRDFALEWTPIKARVSWEIGSKLQLLDLINLTDRQGNNYKLLVTSINYTHAGYVLVESVGYNWKKEKIVLGGNKVRYEQSKSRLIEKNTDLVFAQLDNQHKEFTENYQAERQDTIDDVLAVTGTADENKKAITDAKATIIANTERLTKAEQSVSATKSELQGKITAVEGTVESNYTDLSGKISAINTSNEQTATDIAATKQSIIDLTNKDTEISGVVKNVQELATGNKTVIAQVQKDVTGINTNVIAYKKELDTLEEKSTEMYKAIDPLSTDPNSVGYKVTKAVQTADSITESLTNYADKNFVSTEIQKTAEGITQTISSVETKVNNLEKLPVYTIGTDGYWYKDGVKTSTLAVGKDGTSVKILGSKNSSSELPTTNNTIGDGYIIAGDLYVWQGTSWINAGRIQGPQGEKGLPGPKGEDGQSGANFTWNLVKGTKDLTIGGLTYETGSRKEYQAHKIDTDYDNLTLPADITISFDIEQNTGKTFGISVYNQNTLGPHTIDFKNIQIPNGKSRQFVHTVLKTRPNPTKTENYIEFYSVYGTNNWYKITNLKIELGHTKNPTWSPHVSEIQGADGANGQDGNSFTWNLLKGSNELKSISAETANYIPRTYVENGVTHYEVIKQNLTTITSAGYRAVINYSDLPKVFTVSFEVMLNDISEMTIGSYLGTIEGLTANNKRATHMDLRINNIGVELKENVWQKVVINVDENLFPSKTSTYDINKITRIAITLGQFLNGKVTFRKLMLNGGTVASNYAPHITEIYGADGKDAMFASATPPTDTSLTWLDTNTNSVKRWYNGAWYDINAEIKTNINTLSDTVKDHTRTIGEVQTNLTKKLDTSTFTTFKQGYDKIEATVQKTETDLSKLSVGGRNLISSKSISSGITNTTNAALIDIKLVLTPNTEYIASTSFIETPPNFDIFFRLPSEAASSEENGFSNLKPRKLTTGTDGIAYIAARKTATNGQHIDSLINGTHKVKVEKGNVATDWTPAVEDVTTTLAFNTFQQTVDETLSLIKDKTSGLFSAITQKPGEIFLQAGTDTKTSVIKLTKDNVFIDNALIQTGHIADASITNAKIDTVHGNKIIANTISGDKIVADTALINKLVANSVLADNIWSKYINTKYITSDLITSKIARIANFEIKSTSISSTGGVNGAFITLNGGGTYNFIQAGDNSDVAKFYVDPKGNMVAKSGSIGGWRIADGYLRADGNNNSYVQLDARPGFNSIQIGNKGGTTFTVSDTGDVRVKGQIEATSGTIGNFAITQVLRSIGGSNGAFIQLDGRGIGNFIQAGDSSNGSKFAVSPDGSMRASGATISGTITAKDGQIANFDITGTALRSSGGSNGAYLTLNGGGTYNFIQAGDSTGVKFSVTPKGVLSAKDGSFTGSITASSGTIGAFNISQNYITGPNGLRLSGHSTLNPISVGGSYVNDNGYGSFSSGSWGGSHSGTGSFSSGSYTGSVYSGGGTLGGTSYTNDSGLSFSGSIWVGGLSSNGTVRGSTVSSSSFTSGVRNGSGQLVTATLTSGGWSISNSDIRLKENIEDLGHEFDNFIYDLPLIKYNYIGDEEKTPQAGVNANYLMKVLPEYMAKSFLHQDKNTGLYGAKYELLVPYLIKTIQDLNNRVKELESA